MKLWLKAGICALVSEGIAFALWTTGIYILAAEPQITFLGVLGGSLHWPGIIVENLAHAHGHGDTMFPIIGVPLLCWFVVWTIIWTIVGKLKRNRTEQGVPPYVAQGAPSGER